MNSITFTQISLRPVRHDALPPGALRLIALPVGSPDDHSAIGVCPRAVPLHRALLELARRRLRCERLLRPLAVMLLLIALPAPALAQKPAQPQDSLARLNESMDALTRKVWPSV